MMLSWATQAGGNTMTMNVAAGSEPFKVTLLANPTTGYQWTVKKYDETLFTLVSSQYMAPKTALIGAGGQMVFTFAIKPGVTLPQTSTLTFWYARPWAAKEGTEKKVVIQFQQ